MVRLTVRPLLTLAAALAALGAGTRDTEPDAAARPEPGRTVAAARHRVVQAPDSLVIIANATVRDSALTVAEVRRLFLLRRRFWGDGERAAPVNLPASSPVRDAFSRLVLGQSTTSLSGYWNDLYFHGVSPPPVLESPGAVLLYVARTPGAIGYVRTSELRAATVAAGSDRSDPPAVHVLLTLEDDQ